MAKRPKAGKPFIQRAPAKSGTRPPAKISVNPAKGKPFK
jgi:hypothetical protein